MDVREGDYSDPQRVWGQLPPGSCESFAQSVETESLQKPQRRANQRDEEAIEHWKEKKWPSLKKGALKEGRTIVFADQSGSYLLPAVVVRTYAPVVTLRWERRPSSRSISAEITSRR
jgi:hypothetical protein